MTITDILKDNCILVPLQASEKIAAITELVGVLHKAEQLSDRDDVLRCIIAREETRSTGIGDGLAVPHGKAHGCPKLALAIGKADPPIDFGAKDGKPCSLIFLLASPVDEMGPHIQALARISRIWLAAEFRSAVAEASTARELYQAIAAHQT